MSIHLQPEPYIGAPWDFNTVEEASCSDARNHASAVLAHIQSMKMSWRSPAGLEVPEGWTRFIPPPETDPETHWQRVDLHLWLPFSLISTIVSPVASRLQLIPAAHLVHRSLLDYLGPRFPFRTPPETSDSRFVSAMVDMLLCKDPTLTIYRLASLLDGASCCQLKVQPDVRFPEEFGSEFSSIAVEFALVPEWQPVAESMIRRSQKAPLRPLSPALVIGIQLKSCAKACSLTHEELTYVAQATQPHLEAVLLARNRRSGQLKRSAPAERPTDRDCVFVLATRDNTLFIVAHIPYVHEGTCRYQSLIVDQLPFPPFVSGDQEGVLARLRVMLAVLTIRSHADQFAYLWNEVVWPLAILEADSALLRDCTGIVTPTPSDSVESVDSDSPNPFADQDLASGHEKMDLTASEADIAHSKELVDRWLLGIRDAEAFEPAVHEP
ncbi:hypothetical protein C8R47DRAFT_1322276 [Mycena vitilis]|nr:hypothetical protein C8R47DRAFT_1322276 [Mycena vitilis]